VGTWLAGETVDVVCGNALVEIFHRGVLVISHVARHAPETRIRKRRVVNPDRQRSRRRRGGRTTPSVTRLFDVTGWVSFAGATYKVGKQYTRRSVQVAVIDGLVKITLDGQTIQTHPIRRPGQRTRRPGQPHRPAAPQTDHRRHPHGCKAGPAAEPSSGY
jgi:hypothetical protein